jgi:hypothetical protein
LASPIFLKIVRTWVSSLFFTGICPDGLKIDADEAGDLRNRRKKGPSIENNTGKQ